ncbi:MAG: tetratricopeptide repeat protein, partial [Ktedonobacteraceae bacterium]|nr:tetratricopeptide repeat protein [Ktedonobacteraceae bacterium]
LRAYSLLSRDPHTQMFSVHRLVQAVLRDGMDADAEKQWKQRVVMAVNEARPDLDDVRQWDACELWVPHAQVCAIWIEQEQMMTPEAAFLLNVAGYYLDDRARYEDAEALYVRALSIREQVLGEEHADTATSLNNLAEMYRKQGKHLEAEQLCVRALVICEHVLGREHPSTRLVRRNYVGLLRKMGRNKDAKRVEGS